MKKIEERRMQVLFETIALYNTQTRCTNEFGQCKYHVKGKQGCAVGRLIKSTRLKVALDRRNANTASAVFESLPKSVQALGKGFLGQLQVLHDGADNWNGEGLTKKGESKANDIFTHYVFNL
jgi:predicted NAD-dependent protein-ADP-ribosyltransferase YbiA (DUF1768 family)